MKKPNQKEESQNIWKKLDDIFESQRFENWITPLLQLTHSSIQLSDLAKSAKMLGDLHKANSADSEKRKALGYSVVQALCQIQMNRNALALATLDEIRQLPDSSRAVEFIETRLSKSFSEMTTEEVDFASWNTQEQPQDVINHIREEFHTEDCLQYPKLIYPLFSDLPLDEVQAIIRKARVRRLKPGECLFNEGDSPDAFYLVAEGCAHLSSQRGFEKDFEEGEFFGELGVIGQIPRTATITARDDLVLIEFQKELLVESFVQHPQLEKRILNFFHLRMFLNFAEADPILSQVENKHLLEFYYSFSLEFAKAEQSLFRLGEPSRDFILITCGQVRVKLPDGRERVLGAGHFIGETAFLTQGPRSADVVTLTDTHFLRCRDYMFQNLKRSFPQIEDLLLKISRERQDDLHETSLLEQRTQIT